MIDISDMNKPVISALNYPPLSPQAAGDVKHMKHIIG